MTKSPMLWGAGLACALGGAIAGNALGSTPVLDRSTVADFYQVHETAEPTARQGEPPRDHYPLVTPSGTVPVGELAMRGLYSQRRYRAFAYAADYAPSEMDVEEWQPNDDWRPRARDEALAIGDPKPEPAGNESEPAEPLQLAAGPASIPGEGKAKVVDVNATLAMR